MLLRGISQVELARMKVAYELLKEHVKSVEENLPPPDPQRNPLIDPRSVRSYTLFRHDVDVDVLTCDFYFIV